MSTLKENTIQGASPEISTTDEILDFGFFSDVKAYSLASELFPTIRLNGPTGALLNAKRELDGTDWKVKVLRREVECFESEPVKTSITQEALEDLINTYGSDQAKLIFKDLIEGFANDDENDKVISFLESNSAVTSDLEIKEELTKNAKLLTFLLIQKVNEIVHEANKGTFKTYGAYCLMPAKYSAAFDILRIEGRREEIANQGNIICDTETIVFVRNPLTQDAVDALGLDVNVDEDVYVGLRDLDSPSRSAAVFSPYRTRVVTAINPENGDTYYHLFNRFALSASPLHDVNSPLMWKFKIQEV